MNQVLFNLHDLTLAMTALLCALLAGLYLVAQKQKHTSTPMLAGFLFSHTLIALHELSYYGEQFRFTVLDLSPNLFFIGSFGYLVDAVLLYFFAKALIYKDFKLEKQQLLHLLPAGFFLCYLVTVYYSQSASAKEQIISEWELTTSWHFILVDLAIKLIRVAYVISCLKLIADYQEQQKQQRADISMVDLTWLRTLVLGFIAVMAADVFLATVKAIGLIDPVEIKLLSYIGVTIYHTTFILLLALLTYTIARLPWVEQVQMQPTESSESVNDDRPAQVGRIEAYMQQEKPYLDSEVTLDRLAAALEVSPKVLSVTLNHHFQMNFYEFINHYRIEDAKRVLLADPNRAITELFYDVGFNSKSVFYTFFKKSVGMTPSAYRKKHATSD